MPNTSIRITLESQNVHKQTQTKNTSQKFLITCSRQIDDIQYGKRYQERTFLVSSIYSQPQAVIIQNLKSILILEKKPKISLVIYIIEFFSIMTFQSCQLYNVILDWTDLTFLRQLENFKFNFSKIKFISKRYFEIFCKLFLIFPCL